MMNHYQNFYVQKSPQAFDETLIAFGLAAVVKDLLDRQGDGGGITIEDAGGYYALILSKALLAETVMQECQTLMPARALATDKTSLPEGISVDKYEAIKETVTTFFSTPREMRDKVPAPPKTWDVYRAINPASLPGYNGLMVDWYTVRNQPEALFILLDLYATFPNDFAGAIDAWKTLDKQHNWKINAEATRQQLYNPDSGKGQNKPKADGLSIGNMDSFWLSEWLKAIGFYEAALTKLLKGAKDRKSIVLAPRKLSFELHQAIMSRFSNAMAVSESSVRFDIFAAIRYTRALLDYVSENADDPLMALLGLSDVKQRLVGGFHTAFYKDMGNAIATMNLSFIALPAWVKIESHEAVKPYQDLLEELEGIVRQFDESHSDDVTLLQHLRDFISGDDLTAFFQFTNAFPAFLIGKRERNQYARQMTTEFIERIVMSTEKALSPIVTNTGFQSIAYAIRQSTVTAQYRKQQGDKRYDVRYGLGQELARKARYPHDFIAALSDFLHKYNAENSMVMETKSGPYRRSVKTSDIDEIVRLIDDYGSQTVANLLIAYGHARLSRDEDFSEELKEEGE